MFKIIVSVSVFLIFAYIGTLFSGCSDGWISPSIGHRGACSHHGGVSGIPGMFALLGIIVGGIVFFKLSRRDYRLNHEANSLNLKHTSNLNNCSKADSYAEKQLVASIEKCIDDNQFPMLKIYIYSHCLIQCEIRNKKGGYDCYSRTLNRSRMDELLLTMQNTIAGEKSISNISEYKQYFILMSLSENTQNFTGTIIETIHHPRFLKLRNIMIDALPVLSRKL
ncbi:hypothetical protein ACP6OY_004012 [Cronobacter sakazakii]